MRKTTGRQRPDAVPRSASFGLGGKTIGADGEAGAEFLVRDSTDSRTPHRTELAFNRYGNEEILTHVYERGDKDGVAVVAPSHEQARLEKQGKTPFTHSEAQNP